VGLERPLCAEPELRDGLVEALQVGVDQPPHPDVVALALLHHESEELRVAGVEAHELANHLAGPGARVLPAEPDQSLADPRLELADDPIRRCLPEIVLAAKVVGDETLIRSGPASDLPGAGAAKAPLREALDGGLDDPLPGLLPLLCSGRHGWQVIRLTSQRQVRTLGFSRLFK
jgi:hypothetical protein